MIYGGDDLDEGGAKGWVGDGVGVGIENRIKSYLSERSIKGAEEVIEGGGGGGGKERFFCVF